MNQPRGIKKSSFGKTAFMFGLLVFVGIGLVSCGGGGGGGPDVPLPPAAPPAPLPPQPVVPGANPVLGTYEVRISSIDVSGCANNEVKILLNVLDQFGNQLTDSDLNVSDFTVTINGNPILIDAASYEITPSGTLPVAVSLVADASGSLSQADEDIIINATESFIRDKAADDAGEVIKFKAAVEVMQVFTTDAQALINAINEPFPFATGPGSWLYDALFQGLVDTALQLNPRKAVITLGDGLESGSTKTLNEVIAEAQNSGIPIYTIGLGANIQPDILKDLANQTGGIYYESVLSASLDQVYDSISTVLSDKWIITITVEPADENPGDDLVDVEVVGAGGTGSDSEIAGLCQ